MSLKALFLIASLFVAVKDSVPFNLFIAFNIALSTAFFANLFPVKIWSF